MQPRVLGEVVRAHSYIMEIRQAGGYHSEPFLLSSLDFYQRMHTIYDLLGMARKSFSHDDAIREILNIIPATKQNDDSMQVKVKPLFKITESNRLIKEDLGHESISLLRPLLKHQVPKIVKIADSIRTHEQIVLGTKRWFEETKVPEFTKVAVSPYIKIK